MYTGMGEELIFLPGSITPREPTYAPPVLTERKPRVILKPPVLTEAPPRESTPAPVPSLVVSTEPTTEPGAPASSRWPLYIAAGGVAVIGAVWFFTRK